MASDTAARPSGFFHLPATKQGTRSVMLAVLFGVVLAVFLSLVSPGVPHPVLWVLMGLTVITGLSGLGVGLWAIVRGRERSWLVWFALLPGIVVVFWTSMEILFPH